MAQPSRLSGGKTTTGRRFARACKPIPGSFRAQTVGGGASPGAGGFRGFGGLFTEPPRIAANGSDFLVRSGDACWLLTADAFGATFHGARIEEFETTSRRPALPQGLRLNGSRDERDDKSLVIPLRGAVTSNAANEITLALTESLTHAVVLVALTPA